MFRIFASPLRGVGGGAPGGTGLGRGRWLLCLRTGFLGTCIAAGCSPRILRRKDKARGTGCQNFAYIATRDQSHLDAPEIFLPWTETLLLPAPSRFSHPAFEVSK